MHIYIVLRSMNRYDLSNLQYYLSVFIIVHCDFMQLFLLLQSNIYLLSDAGHDEKSTCYFRLIEHRRDSSTSQMCFETNLCIYDFHTINIQNTFYLMYVNGFPHAESEAANFILFLTFPK